MSDKPKSNSMDNYKQLEKNQLGGNYNVRRLQYQQSRNGDRANCIIIATNEAERRKWHRLNRDKAIIFPFSNAFHFPLSKQTVNRIRTRIRDCIIMKSPNPRLRIQASLSGNRPRCHVEPRLQLAASSVSSPSSSSKFAQIFALSLALLLLCPCLCLCFCLCLCNSF